MPVSAQEGVWHDLSVLLLVGSYSWTAVVWAPTEEEAWMSMPGFFDQQYSILEMMRLERAKRDGAWNVGLYRWEILGGVGDR